MWSRNSTSIRQKTSQPNKEKNWKHFETGALTVECQLVELTENICIHLLSVLLAPPVMHPAVSIQRRKPWKIQFRAMSQLQVLF